MKKNKSKIGKEMADIRWKKTSKEDRKKHGAILAKGRKDKLRKMLEAVKSGVPIEDILQ